MGSLFPADLPLRALIMEVIIFEAGYSIWKSKCWSAVEMRDKEIFHDEIESVEHEVEKVSKSSPEWLGKAQAKWRITVSSA